MKITHKDHGLTKELLESYYGEGMTETEVAAKHGISQPAVAYYRKKWGMEKPIARDRIARKAKKEGKRDIREVGFSEFEALYSIHGERKMGEMFGCSKQLIRTLRNEFKLSPLGKRDRNNIRLGGFTQEQNDLIIGGMLGDGGIRGGRYNEFHSHHQKDYLEWKLSILGSTMKLEESFGKLDDGRPYRGWKMSSRAYDYFCEREAGWYESSSGFKILSREDVTHTVTPLTLAVWYFDDGFCHSNYRYELSSGFSKDEMEWLSGWVSGRWSIPSHVIQIAENQFSIVIEDACLFSKIISPYVKVLSQVKKTREIDRFEHAWCGADMGVYNRSTAYTKTDWERSDEDGRRRIVSDLVLYNRTLGFPHKKVSSKKLDLSLEGIRDIQCEITSFIEPPLVPYGSILEKYFPHITEAKKIGKRSPQDVFDSSGLSDSIVKVVEKSGRKKLCNRNALRGELFSRGGVGNFNPVVAKSLIDHFGAKRVFDPCGGYGGRLLGFFASDADRYICVDANPDSVKSLRFLANLLNRRIKKEEVGVLYGSAEDVVIGGGFDMVLTSPPYWNNEQYCDSEEQVSSKYKSYDSFLEGFVNVLVRKCYGLLDADGILIWNVADFVSDGFRYPFERDVINIVRHVFGDVDRIDYRMKKRYSRDRKSEAILIAKK